MSEKERAGTGFKVRLRDRRGYSREAQGYIGWSEYQVVSGRRVIARLETLAAVLKQFPGAELDASIIHHEAIAKARK